MRAFEELRQGLEQAWDHAVEGWRDLRERAGAALTRFYPLRSDDDQPPTREQAHERRGAAWGLLAAEVVESDRDVEVRLEAPGMEAGDFDLSVHNQTLVIEGQKRVDRQIDDGRFHVMERAYGAFQRAIPLPSPVDDSNAEARYHNGVLVVRLPRTERPSQRRITVTGR